MTIRKLALVSGVVLGLGSASVFAQEEDNASIALGYVGTSGNTETQTFNLEFLMAIDSEQWLHNIKFQALGATENDEAKAERYFLEDKSDYNLDEMQYLFVKGNYTDDRFSGFEYQAAVSAGYGRYLRKDDIITFQAFGGLGYRQNDVIGGESDGEAIVSLGESFSWQISDNAKLTQSLTSEAGSDLTVTRFEIGLETNIVDAITTKIAFQARNTSEVPVGTEKTDTQTSISLVYSF